jgi:hypothetical protein
MRVPAAILSYTAFGEPVWQDPNGGVTIGDDLPAGSPRYGYAGGWGYEASGFDAEAGILTLDVIEFPLPVETPTAQSSSTPRAGPTPRRNRAGKLAGFPAIGCC